MSTQRGNVQKKKPPKHQNKTAFKNSMHDTSKRTKEINAITISGVCTRCKDILEWKIKYKKYKPLTQPKKCTKCQEKTVKHAYHIICAKCRDAEGICAKCGSSVHEAEDLERESRKEREKADEDEDIREELAFMSERERRTFLRKQGQVSTSNENPSESKSGEYEQNSEDFMEKRSGDIDEEMEEMEDDNIEDQRQTFTDES